MKTKKKQSERLYEDIAEYLIDLEQKSCWFNLFINNGIYKQAKNKIQIGYFSLGKVSYSIGNKSD
jgi:hypothetical protein